MILNTVFHTVLNAFLKTKISGGSLYILFSLLRLYFISTLRYNYSSQTGKNWKASQRIGGEAVGKQVFSYAASESAKLDNFTESNLTVSN